MRNIILLTFLIFYTSFANGQMKILVVHDRNKADVLVFKTTFFSEADLVIKKTWDHNDVNKKFHWYFVDNKKYAKPDWVVFYTNDIREANHVVYFTNRPKLLGSYSACEPISRQ